MREQSLEIPMPEQEGVVEIGSLPAHEVVERDAAPSASPHLPEPEPPRVDMPLPAPAGERPRGQYEAMRNQEAAVEEAPTEELRRARETAACLLRPDAEIEEWIAHAFGRPAEVLKRYRSVWAIAPPEQRHLVQRVIREEPERAGALREGRDAEIRRAALHNRLTRLAEAERVEQRRAWRERGVRVRETAIESPPEEVERQVTADPQLRMLEADLDALGGVPSVLAWRAALAALPPEQRAEWSDHIAPERHQQLTTEWLAEQERQTEASGIRTPAVEPEPADAPLPAPAEERRDDAAPAAEVQRSETMAERRTRLEEAKQRVNWEQGENLREIHKLVRPEEVERERNEVERGFGRVYVDPAAARAAYAQAPDLHRLAERPERYGALRTRRQERRRFGIRLGYKKNDAGRAAGGPSAGGTGGAARRAGAADRGGGGAAGGAEDGVGAPAGGAGADHSRAHPARAGP